MGPIQFHPGDWLLVDPAERAPQSKLDLQSDSDRRMQRHFQRRERQGESEPEADEFRRRNENPEAGE